MPYLRSPFENGMLTLWVRVGSVRTLALVHVLHREAGWWRYVDYPVQYLILVSVDMVYSYLSCSGFRLICLFAHCDSLAIAR